jgi:hypothetical protein
MADLSKTTADVTIFDNESDNYADVTANHELLVRDNGDFTDGDRWQYLVKNGLAFSTITNFVTISGQLETDFILMLNPNASGKTVYFNDIIYTYNKGSGISIVKFYRNPTITTNGTSQTINKKLLSQSASSVCSVYYAPTISNRGTLREIVGQSAVGSFIFEPHLGKCLEANESLLISITPAANNTDHSVYFDWGEQ